MPDISEKNENVEETTPVKNNGGFYVKEPSSAPCVVNHVMYPESTIKNVLAILNGINITGAENAMKLADAYKTLSSGQVVPVTIEN